jgi:hypothetical protein
MSEMSEKVMNDAEEMHTRMQKVTTRRNGMISPLTLGDYITPSDYIKSKTHLHIKPTPQEDSTSVQYSFLKRRSSYSMLGTTLLLVVVLCLWTLFGSAVEGVTFFASST